MDILNVQNVSCKYSDVEIISDISFSVKRGEFLGIIGPNGAGKSTLFRAISGILKYSKGNIFYKNKNISKIKPYDLAKEVAVVPQIMGTSFPFSVKEFISMGRFPRCGRFRAFNQKDYLALERVLEFTNTSFIQDRMINELSGGEKQRVIIAQCFAQEPELLLLDEPTSHLDITYQVQIMDLLKSSSKNDGITVIIILHDLNLASAYCDKLIFLNAGKIFMQGTPFETLTYQNIETVYKTGVIVKENPLNGKPYIILITNK